MNAKPYLFKQTAPDRLEIKKGGGCLALFGLPFFLAGIFMLLIATGILPVSNADEVPSIARYLIFFMGLIFSGVGAALVWGRTYTSIDRSQGQVSVAKGLIVPLKTEVYRLDSYQKLIIKHDPGDSDSAETFSLRLDSDSGGPELVLFSTSFYGDTRDQAMLLKDFLNLPLYDRSTDHEEIFEALKPSAKNAKSAAKIPAFVPELDCTVNESETEFSVAFKGSPLSLFETLIFLVPLLFFIFIGTRFMPILFSPGTPRVVSLFFGGFFFLFLMMGPLLRFLRQMILVKRDVLILSIRSGSLELKQCGVIFCRKQSFSSLDIYGFDFSSPQTLLEKDNLALSRNTYPVDPSKPYIPDWAHKLSRLSRSKGVVIKTRSGLHYVGAGLPDDQLSYLYTLISEAYQRLCKQPVD